MIELIEWIKDGITISKTNTGYRVFTIPTQHFDITELSELTPERFKAEVEKQTQHEEWERDLFSEAFKDLFN